MTEIILGIWFLSISICMFAGGLIYWVNGDRIREGMLAGLMAWLVGSVIILPIIAGVALLLR